MVSGAKQRESLSKTAPSDSFEETLRDQLPLRERPSEWEEEKGHAPCLGGLRNPELRVGVSSGHLVLSRWSESPDLAQHHGQ